MTGWTDDLCLSIWAAVYGTGRLSFPPGAQVLEVGCAEADWLGPMRIARPDLHLIGIDWREADRPAADLIIRGDVLAYDFLPASFDAVIACSTVEHIGLGHYDQDPLDVDGDTRCMERVARWLKPRGWAYLDVPFREAGFLLHGDEYRAYDNQTLASRLIVPGLRQAGRWFWPDLTLEPDRQIAPWVNVALYLVKEGAS